MKKETWNNVWHDYSVSDYDIWYGNKPKMASMSMAKASWRKKRWKACLKKISNENKAES